MFPLEDVLGEPPQKPGALSKRCESGDGSLHLFLRHAPGLIHSIEGRIGELPLPLVTSGILA